MTICGLGFRGVCTYRYAITPACKHTKIHVHLFGFGDIHQFGLVGLLFEGQELWDLSVEVWGLRRVAGSNI